MFLSSSSERVVSGGPLRSPPFTIIIRCPGLWAVRCVTLTTSRNQLLRGLPGFLLQPGSDAVPTSSSTNAWRASCAGVPSDRRLASLKMASLLSPMTARVSGRPVFSATDEFVTKSDHRIPRMRRCVKFVVGLQFISLLSCVQDLNQTLSSTPIKTWQYLNE